MNLPKILRQTDEPAKQTVSASPLETRITAVRDLKTHFAAFISRKSALETQAAEHVAALDLSEAACASFSAINAGLALAVSTEKALRGAAVQAFSVTANDHSRAGTRIRQTHADIDAAIRDLAVAALPPELAGLEVTVKDTHALGHFVQNAGAKNVSTLHISATKWGKVEAAVRYDPFGAHISSFAENTATIDEIMRRIGEWLHLLEPVAKEEVRSVAALASLRSQLPKPKAA